MTRKLRRPEILAPAGDPVCLRAAIAAGADAVYFGMARFNARGRAERFRGVTLEACIQAAHDHGARAYVTLNTLLHDDELATALDLAAQAKEASADAVIVQDAGLALLVRRHLPSLPLHGSTQMTLHQEDQAAEAVTRLGLERIILARECSLEEIRRIAERVRPLGAGVEVFTHGALCYAYSGQCLMSNFAGRRSANRGICAQNCRFDFCVGPTGDPAVPGEPPAFEKRRATQLISMKDLAAFEWVAHLADSGVEAFKIEGRLKGPDYVAEVTRLYRAALDAWEAGSAFAAAEAERAAGRVYSRGFTDGYLAARVDSSMRGDKRYLEGEPDATVVSAHRKTGVLLLAPRQGQEIRPGQGYRYAHDRYRGGFRVLAVTGDRDGAKVVRVRFGAEASGRRHRRGATGRRRPPPPLPVGLACYLNDDPELSRRNEALVATVSLGVKPRRIHFFVSGRCGEKLKLRAVGEEGRTAEAESGAVLEAARSRSLDAATLQEHLGRLGGTAYELASLDASALETGAFLGFPEIHALRRDIVEKLGRPPHPAFSLPEVDPRESAARLSVCVGNPESFEAALRGGGDRAIIEDGRIHEASSEWEAAWGAALAAAKDPWFRLPPIVHDARADQRALERVHRVSSGARILAGHCGQLRLATDAGLPVAADFYLNAYNHLAVEALRASGARQVTLSLELDAKEALNVAGRASPDVAVEVVVGGRVFSMLTRQDHALRRGEGFHATSEHGQKYRFETGPGGTTIIYEARELVGVRVLPALCRRVDWLRLDLAHQRPEAVEGIVRAYKAVLGASGGEDGPGAMDEALAHAEEVHSQYAPAGSFAGHLIRGARAQDEAPL